MSTTTSPKSLSTPQNAALATGYSRLYLSTAEKRIRNRSLCSLLWTPPLYPGYSAKLEKSSKQKISLLPVENEEINWSSPKKETNSKESSGYGSGASESDPENDHHSKKALNSVQTGNTVLNVANVITTSNNEVNSNIISTDIDNIDIGAVNIISDNNQAADEDLRTSKRTQARQLRNRHVTIEKARRRSIPACLRDAFSDEIARVLEINGVLQYETDADTGIRRPIGREQSINRPESVIQLARKFAEATAAQDKRIYISNQKLLANGQNLSPTARSQQSSPIHTGWI